MQWLVGERSEDAAAVDTQADDPDAELAIRHRNQAIMLSLQGYFAESESYSREALRLRPDDVDVLNELGAAVWRQGRRPRPRRSTAGHVRSSPTISGS